MRERNVPCGPAGFTIPSHVQPVTSPSLTERGGLEQSIDHFLEGIRCRFLDELCDFVRGRWKSGEIKCDATNQRQLVGVWCWLQPRLGKLGDDKAINLVDDKRFVRHLGWNHFFEWLPSPMFFTQLVIFGFGSGQIRRNFDGWPCRSVQNPLFQIGDLFLAELFFRWHLRPFVPHGLDQQAFCGISWLDARTPSPPFNQPLAIINPQYPFYAVFGRVAIDTVFNQEWSNFFLEEFDLRRIVFRKWFACEDCRDRIGPHRRRNEQDSFE